MNFIIDLHNALADYWLYWILFLGMLFTVYPYALKKIYDEYGIWTTIGTGIIALPFLWVTALILFFLLAFFIGVILMPVLTLVALGILAAGAAGDQQ